MINENESFISGRRTCNVEKIKRETLKSGFVQIKDYPTRCDEKLIDIDSRRYSDK